MALNWDVLQYVANRYGKVQEVFDNAKERLKEVKEGKKPLTELEDNKERVALRVARETEPVPVAIERINGIANFQDTWILKKLSQMSLSVCRILKNGIPYGTGFLIAENIIITNHHVIGTPVEAANMEAEFDYEYNEQLKLKEPTRFKMDAATFFLTSSLEYVPDVPNSGLDFTMIALAAKGTGNKSITAYKPITLDGNIGKIIKGESCVVIQHPNGMPKKVVIKDTSFFSETRTRLVYESDTLPGSSGSIVIGLGTCEVIALHHAGLPRTDAQNRVLTKSGTVATPNTPDEEIDWIGNEGIKVSRIIAALEEANLSPGMEQGRNLLLGKTKQMAANLVSKMNQTVVYRPTQEQEEEQQQNEPPQQEVNTPIPQNNTAMNNNDPATGSGTSDYLITAYNTAATRANIELSLKANYGSNYRFYMAMPASATEGELELFVLQIPQRPDPEQEIKELLAMPGISNAEVDREIALNADRSFIQKEGQGLTGTESAAIAGDGYGEPNEDKFLLKYQQTSVYVKDKEAHFYRMWNWEATNFNKFIKSDPVSPKEQGIRIVQFDTGFSDHSKVVGGFDIHTDHNFLDGHPDNAWDPGTVGVLKQPRHGTRTGSLLIGNEYTAIPTNGNCGLLAKFQYKLTPYRIAESVILINRQRQLAAALDMAINQGYDVITMSMGLPPTIATARMAKKAYDKGVIWCCAAGNEVQAVIAPAVYPGTIAIAASNPLDADWGASSRGNTVDITAPGEDVYVPILYKDRTDNNTIKEGFAYGNGTSYATPHVAAAAAYWLAKHKTALNQPEYRGWRKVEAFRQALQASARKSSTLPTHGFGKGILDVDKLLKEPLAKASDLEYAYNNWNENAFLATLQGVGEIGKTYWNRLHNWLFGTRHGNQEALMPEYAQLSESARKLEQQLFGTNIYEATGDTGYNTTLERFNTIHQIIESSAKK